MSDPRADNCKAYREDATGKVVGVELGIASVANSRYAVYSVRLRDEYQAQGNTVARCQVLDKNGVNTGIAVRMAWPGQGPTFQASALPGNPSNEHFVPNKYWPPDKGPLAFFVGGHNAPISDIVYGVGLPKGHHVSFDIIFRERGSTTTPDKPTDPAPGTGTLADHEKRLRRIEKLLNSWQGD